MSDSCEANNEQNKNMSAKKLNDRKQQADKT